MVVHEHDKLRTKGGGDQRAKQCKHAHFAYLVVIQPFLQDYLQLGDDLVAVLLDAKEGGHVLVVGQH